MKILLTGSRGMLGRALAKAFADHDVVATDSSSLDITDRAGVFEIVAREKPDVILNAAAYTNVDLAESEPERALAVNGTAVGYLAEAAREVNALLVHFSTDYVFDGQRERGYREDAIPGNPVNAYGASKLAGERLLIESDCRYALIRTSWLFGPDGKNFVATMLRLGAERDTLNVVADQHGCPTYTRDLAAVTRTIIADGATGIFHIANSGVTTWADFAREIFRQAGLATTVVDIPASAYPTPAVRPLHSVLLNTRRQPLRLWHDALADYLKQKR